MANSQLDVYNLALSKIGAKAKLTDVDEVSREAEVCNLWYKPTLRAVLRAAPWDCATAHKRLALLAERTTSEAWESGDPDPGWRFAYEAPSDMVRPRHLTTFDRFMISLYDSSHAIMTSKESPILVYTKAQMTVALWDDMLFMAVAGGLAANICAGITGKLERARMASEEANRLIWQARQMAANQDENELESYPDWMIARGYGVTTNYQRYIYPFGPLLQVGGGVSVE